MFRRLLPSTLFAAPRSAATTLARALHPSLPAPPIPPRTTAVPDVTTFLTKIGRNTTQHAAKFETWEQFFGLTSAQMKALGIEPTRDRRYILHWREAFRVAGDRLVLREHKRGVKVDGGERRRKEVRAKRRAAENKERRQAEENDKVEKGKGYV
ncbi:IGR protein motif-domain-containing protein [Morchella snyderi]|nr:IGR protein motif-domain-containing protein [Morchella snyderi]